MLMGNTMVRLALSLLVLMAMTALTCSQASVHLGGSDGVALMRNLTGTSQAAGEINSSANVTGINNTSINSTSINSTGNDTAGNSSQGGLWSWGSSKPRKSPAPPTAAQYRDYQYALIVRDNREE